MSISRRRAASGQTVSLRAPPGSGDDLLPATAFQELSQLPQLHPDRVLMRCRNAGVEADARERAGHGFRGGQKPHRESLYFGQVFRAFSGSISTVVLEAQAPQNWRFSYSGSGVGNYSRRVTHGPLE